MATNSEQTYHRYLRHGDRVSASSRLERVAGPKRTALGEGWWTAGTRRSIRTRGSTASPSLTDHQASRWVAEPLHLLDCCQESDGGVALVITSAERARDLAQPPVIASAAQGGGPDQYVMTSYYREELAALPEIGVVGRQLWAQSQLAPSDVDVAVLYDHFTPYVLMQMEELDFCGRGETKDFIAGDTLEIGGKLPLNPHGGQLGKTYIHGMNGIAEGVRQIRGSAINQVADAGT